MPSSSSSSGSAEEFELSIEIEHCLIVPEQLVRKETEHGNDDD